MRKDEEFARLAFERFLSNREFPNHWQDGKDPPDFEVTINGVVHPVEVAQLMESVASGNQELSERGWTARLTKIADKVEAEMKNRGVLSGTYCIHLAPAPEPYQVLKSVLVEIEHYLIATRDKVIAESCVLWRGMDGARWSIDKRGSKENILGYTISIGDAKFLPKIEDDLRQMLGAELADKRDKTRGMYKVILLFIDAYHLADPPHWQRVASEIDFSPFHTVARVYDDYQCQILHSVQEMGSGLTY